MFDYYLDLSSSNTGVVLVSKNINEPIIITSWDFSKIKINKEIEKSQKQTKKLQYIGKFLKEFEKKYPVENIYLEGIFVQPQFRNSSEVLLKLHGVLMGTFYNKTILYTPPSVIKKVVTGKGNAKKEIVQDNIKRILNCSIRNSDEADALALMLTNYPEGKDRKLQFIEKNIVR